MRTEPLVETMRIPIDPELPPDFDSTPNHRRPRSHQRWWHRPYIETYDAARLGFESGPWLASWLEHWPAGVRYDVRCLDGGAWDRSTWHGSFPALDAALARVRELEQEIAF